MKQLIDHLHGGVGRLGFLAFLTLALSAMLAVPVLAADIVVGGLFSITGPQSYLGEPERNTLEMAVEEINAKGGINGNKVHGGNL